MWLKDEELVWKTGVVTSAFDGSRLSAAADDDPTGDVREVVVKPDKDIPDKEQVLLTRTHIFTSGTQLLPRDSLSCCGCRHQRNKSL